MELRVIPVQQDLLETLAQVVLQGWAEHLELSDLQDLMDLPEFQAIRDQVEGLDQLVQQDLTVQREVLVRLDLQDLQEQMEVRELLGHQVQLVDLVFLDQLGLQELLVLQVLPGR